MKSIFILVIVPVLMLIIPNVYASSSNVDVDKWEKTCYESGIRDGNDRPFSDSAYEECGDFGDGAQKYYKGFIDGCIDAGNTKDTCETFTDE